MANNIQLYTIGPLEFPSLDINSVEGKWAADCVAHERQQIKRNRLMQDMLETGVWEEMPGPVEGQVGVQNTNCNSYQNIVLNN